MKYLRLALKQNVIRRFKIMHTSKMMEAYQDGVMFSDEDIIEGL